MRSSLARSSAHQPELRMSIGLRRSAARSFSVSALLSCVLVVGACGSEPRTKVTGSAGTAEASASPTVGVSQSATATESPNRTPQRTATSTPSSQSKVALGGDLCDHFAVRDAARYDATIDSLNTKLAGGCEFFDDTLHAKGESASALKIQYPLGFQTPAKTQVTYCRQLVKQTEKSLVDGETAPTDGLGPPAVIVGVTALSGQTQVTYQAVWLRGSHCVLVGYSSPRAPDTGLDGFAQFVKALG